MSRRNLRRAAASEREAADQAEPVETEEGEGEGQPRDAQGRFLPRGG